MREYIAFDCHKRYTLVEREEIETGKRRQYRVEHGPGSIMESLRGGEPGSPVAVEAVGNWYWIVDEIERAGLDARLVHPRKAKLMMGMINKTDKLDVHGLNVLQRNGTLPTVWIPPGELRDLRELTRTRMFFSHQRTSLKNRIQSTLRKYGWIGSSFSDPFGKKGREQMSKAISQMPQRSSRVTKDLFRQLDLVEDQVSELEVELRDLVKGSSQMSLLMSLPGIGWILAAVIALELGDIGRFASAERLASYAGTTPRVHASGDKVRYGRLRPDVNRKLKWAYIEAANSVCLNHKSHPLRHVSLLYMRLMQRKGHFKAIGAVARHLAESTYHVLSKGEPYRDPILKRVNPGGPKRESLLIPKRIEK